MEASSYDYDLVVIGSGPGGQRAAIQAAKLDKRVAIIEKTTVVGGVSVNLGTIPSKTLREAVLDLSGFRSREFYGSSYRVKENITIQDLLVRTNQVNAPGIDIARHQQLRNHVELISATASFVDPHTLKLDLIDGSTSRHITAANVVIASGTETTRDSHIPFDGTRIFTSAAAHDRRGRRRCHRLRVREHHGRARRAGDADRRAPRAVVVYR
jgi:NAD(P) transhydrogenase